ncbi:receptor-like protein 32 isoform X2 [Euphorbia lathyris]|uniref:receptor-like protein 32 isoform X2 n=1 Tax=Euphorbia lathyris TaxID=212925 RepID=UPI0033144331
MERSNQTLLIIVCSPRPPLLMRKELYVLNLTSNRFNSSILASLGALKSLQTLVMGDNEITSIFPKEIGKLKYLETLYLSYNYLRGMLPLQGKYILWDFKIIREEIKNRGKMGFDIRS